MWDSTYGAETFCQTYKEHYTQLLDNVAAVGLVMDRLFAWLMGPVGSAAATLHNDIVLLAHKQREWESNKRGFLKDQ